MKTRHQLAFAEVEKLKKSLKIPPKEEDDEEDEGNDELELKTSSILMASFCEDFPKDAVPDISLDDQLPISRHIEKITTEYAKRQGVATPQKKRKAGPAIR